ncbi:MAG: succinate--CoA ligase subunit alpha [Burkholderiales bacterium]|nr:succinate--CoA ligase subunit alpha [Burkholderiales bacterium]
MMPRPVFSLSVDRHTPVLVQGITGRAGQRHARMMRDAGTAIVGGVSARTDIGPVDGIPVFGDCADAVAATGAVASVLLVGAAQVLPAVTEALAAGIRLVVTPTEGVPVHDAVEIRNRVDAAGAVWIGASTPGMAIPGEAKLGFLPDVSLAPGPVAMASKSGTLSYEAGFRLVQAGLGQSAWIGVGGDPVKGTRFADLAPWLARHGRTEAVLLVGEIGGNEEEEFAQAVAASRLDKPVVALIAGRTAPGGVSMGHAGALTWGSFGTWEAKRAALAGAGVHVCATIDEAVKALARALGAARG